MMTDDFACEQCCKCHWYFLNNDTEDFCIGQKKEPCEEWIKYKYLKENENDAE